MCKTKEGGVLDIKDIQRFNEALIGKWNEEQCMRTLDCERR